MRVLLISEFDPAGVLTGWRRALRTAGVDCRLVVNAVTQIPVEPDWVTGEDYKVGQEYRDFETLMTFTKSADVAVWNPAIGQPWAYSSEQVVLRDGPDHPLHTWISDALYPDVREVTVIHGSRNAQKNAEVYAAHWRGLGHKIWATTLDYAHRLSAAYAPPLVETSGLAPLRGDDDPLVIAHAPTDPDISSTDVFLRSCAATGAVADLIFQQTHEEVIRRKRKCSAGFDHLRGAPSVNTIENLSLGLVPLVGLKEEYKSLFYSVMGLPVECLFPFEDERGLMKTMRWLAEDARGTREIQLAAREWYQRSWNRGAIGRRLVKLLGEL
jgi:hypothetical protein